MIKKILFISCLCMICASCSSTDEKTESKVRSHSDKQDEPVKMSSAEQKKQEKIYEEVEKTLKTNVNEAEERFKNSLRSQNEDSLLSAGAILLNQNPENTKVLLGYADFYLKKGYPDVARIFYGRILDKNPDHPDANNNLGVLAIKEKKEAEAVVYFKRALKGQSSHKEANYNLGSYYLKYFDYEKAEQYLDSAYNSDSKDYEVANNYAISLRGTGQLDKALGIYKSIEGKSSSTHSMLNQAILLSEFKKDYKAAREIVSKIRFITTDPGILKKVNALIVKMDQLESK